MLHVPAPTTAKRRHWCGPYAIAVALGVSYDAAYDFIKGRRASGRPVMGMYNSELVRTLKAAGCYVRSTRPREEEAYEVVSAGGTMTVRGHRAKPMTFARWLKVADLEPGFTYIVNVTGHYLTVKLSGSHIRIIDNQSKTWQGPSVRKGKGSYKRARVFEVFVVGPPEKALPKAAPKKRPTSYAAKARKLAAELDVGIDAERDSGLYGGWAIWLENTGWDDENFCTGWEQCYYRLCSLAMERKEANHA